MAHTRYTNSTIKKISSVIGNRNLARDIYSSIEFGLNQSRTSSAKSNSVWSIFLRSLNSSIRDIENHPYGELFKRLIEFGPANPGEPKILISDKKTVLSDPECERCVEFIYSHMINRFKGELAEMLSIQPCINLINKLKTEGRLPEATEFISGEEIKEKRRLRSPQRKDESAWGGFAKGADGLLVRTCFENDASKERKIDIIGIVEVKSMGKSVNELNRQINSHIDRLKGGLRIGDTEWTDNEVKIPEYADISGKSSAAIKIMVVPSMWKLNRKWQFKNLEDRRVLIPPPLDIPPKLSSVEEVLPDTWKITLSWSKEALDEVAYEMTYWYMSKVGASLYQNKPLPKEWEGMTPEEAGYNAIKMMLYYMPLRPIKKRKVEKAIKLYNVYCFGYPLGADNKDMLWPEDVEKMIGDS